MSQYIFPIGDEAHKLLIFFKSFFFYIVKLYWCFSDYELICLGIKSADKYTWMSFTKLCDASFDHLTHHGSHELILLTKCCVGLGCVPGVSLCVASYFATRTQRMNIFMKDIPGLSEWLNSMIFSLVSLPNNLVIHILAGSLCLKVCHNTVEDCSLQLWYVFLHFLIS